MRHVERDSPGRSTWHHVLPGTSRSSWSISFYLAHHVLRGVSCSSWRISFYLAHHVLRGACRFTWRSTFFVAHLVLPRASRSTWHITLYLASRSTWHHVLPAHLVVPGASPSTWHITLYLAHHVLPGITIFVRATGAAKDMWKTHGVDKNTFFECKPSNAQPSQQSPCISATPAPFRPTASQPANQPDPPRCQNYNYPLKAPPSPSPSPSSLSASSSALDHGKNPLVVVSSYFYWMYSLNLVGSKTHTKDLCVGPSPTLSVPSLN